MRRFKDPITIMTLVFFFAASLPFPGGVYAKRSSRGKDPYAKFTDQQLVDMAQKDYDTAIRYAKANGVIKTEDEVFKLIAKAQQQPQRISKKAMTALKKRGINPNPSAFLGAKRAKILKKAGLDVDNASMLGVSAKDIFKKSFHYDEDDEKPQDLMAFYKAVVKFIGNLLIKEAFARETRNSAQVGPVSERQSDRIQRSNVGVRANRSNTVTRDANTPTYEDQQIEGRMTDEELAALEDMYNQPSVEDAWIKAMANRAKGMKDLSGEIKQKKSMGMMLITAGALLMALGFAMMMKGMKNISDGKKKISEGQAKVQKGNGMMAQCAAIPEPASKAACMAKANQLIQQGQQQIQEGQSQVEQGKQEKQTGMMMIMAGAALIMMGMKMLGEAAAMEDEMKEQEKKNKEIDDARKKLMEKDAAKKEQQRKIIEYRQRTRELEEKQNQENRNRLQDQIQNVR